MKHQPPVRKHFLFLQGPPGPFFAMLADRLEQDGHRVHRINFNGGDRASWPGPATDYRGNAADWPRFFDAFVVAERITDLVLFGDCRPLHRTAHGMATLRKLRIHVLEEGYIRPDWMTLELDGVNGNSTLSRDPKWYLAEARGLPPLPTFPPVASSFERRAREAFAYYAQSIFQIWRFPHYRSHRPQAALLESYGWFWRLLGRGGARRRSQQVLKTLGDAPYFAFPLQLNSDHQIRTHSPFGSMKVAAEYVIESFARAAPPETRLLIKEHPLDNGLINWRRLIGAQAAALGVADRVLLLEEGDVARIVAKACGVVTINSTTGTLALSVGVPTAVLGQAVYHIAGITHQGPLDSFWRSPSPPKAELYDAFCRVLLNRCLIRGGFLSDEGLALLVDGAVQRLGSGQRLSVLAGGVGDRSAG
ncbi:MAG: Capsule polysaccharide biosynthesis protein [Sphingomonas bacterium]|nr:Capsule polysaccharide biosynthesis protein [Sphingomonas bacterium]